MPAEEGISGPRDSLPEIAGIEGRVEQKALTSFGQSCYLLEKLMEKTMSGGSPLIRGLLLILIVFLGATFAVMNREEVTLRFFFNWQTGPIPFFLFIFIALGAGLVVGFLFGWGERRKIRKKGRELGAQIESLRGEVEALKREVPPPATPSLKPPDAGESPPA